MNAYRWSVIVALVFLPLASSAQELRLGVDFQGGYDSNLFNVESEEVDDYSFRISPDARLEDHEGELQWELRYRPSYEYSIDVPEARGWDHLAQGELSWQINPTTRLAVSDRFGYFQSVSRFNEVVTQGVGDAIVDVTGEGFGLNRNTRNTIDASLTHSLAPTRMLVFNLGYNLIDYAREGTSGRDTLSATGRYVQTVSLRDELGGGVSYRRSSFDGTAARSSQSTEFYNVFGSWRHRFDETLELNVALGPTWVSGDDQDDIRTEAQNVLLFPLLSIDGEARLVRASSCPTEDGALILTADCDVISESLLPAEVREAQLLRTDLELEGPVPSRSNQSLTYFANMSLSKRWEQWTGTISYRRQQSDSSGLGSSTIADVVSGILEWRPSPRWHSSLRVAVTRQSQQTSGVQSVVAVTPVDIIVFPSARILTDVAQSTALRAVEVDQDLEYLTLWLNLGVRYRLTERTTLFSNLFYWKQNADGDTGLGREYDRYRVSLGVEYRFDPIRL